MEVLKIMNVLLINGSPHKKGCTYAALNEVSKVLKEYKINSEILDIGKKSIHPCTACMKCKKTGKCKYGGLPNKILKKMIKFDAVVLGSPVCYGGPTGALCANLDRVCFSITPKELKGKLGASIVVTHYKDGGATLDRLNQYFLSTKMELVETSKDNVLICHKVKDFKKNEEGLKNLKILAESIAENLKK